jgi:NAD(P)-dependent dehydrogenase (short-subunit alcohol dehydrogenase family)
MKKLENKTVFITGGLSGIGKACAVHAALEGANVVVVDIKSVAYDAAMAEIKAENENATFIDCDVTATGQVASAISKTVEKFGSLDIALNNAGVSGGNEKIGDLSEDDWNSTIKLNLTSVFTCMKYELAQMASQKKGVIVNMSSIHGKVGFAHSAAYVAAKHGVIGLTRTAALEYAADGIRVNAICPGFVETPLLTKDGVNDNEKKRNQFKALHPLNRFGKSDEIAKGFIFLATDDSAFVTGSALEMDGGYLAQ